jgi:CRISPR system Cascade subunit CasB
VTVQTPKADYRARQLERPDRFVAYIRRICEEPGRRAGLRRGVGHRPETAYRSHAYVAGWIPTGDSTDGRAHEATEWAYYAVAAMMAAQPGRARRDEEADTDPASADDDAPTPGLADVPGPRVRTNLGVSLAQAVARGAATQRVIAHDSAEKRLHLLTRQGLAGVHRHLPATVRHLRSANVPIDWAVLILDLSRWATARDYVAKDWLQHYYRTLTVPADPTALGSAES